MGFIDLIRTIKKITWHLLGPRCLFLYGKRPLPHTPDIGESRFVFICGLHRSGTSVVHRSLGRHSPLVSTFVNTGVPEDEAQHLQNVLPSGRQLGGPGRFAFHTNGHLTEAHPLARAEARDTILKQWGPYLDFSKKLILEKSPPNITRTRLLQSLFPGAIFIFLVRHPIPVALATQRRWKVGGISGAIAHWFRAHEIMLSDIDHLENYGIIRYEDIVSDPERILARVFNFLDLPDDVNYGESFFNANIKYFLQWNELIDQFPNLESSIEKEMSTIKDLFGYSFSAPYSEPIPADSKLNWI